MKTAQLQKNGFWLSFTKIFLSKEMIISLVGGTILLFLGIYINRLNPSQPATSNIYIDQSKTIKDKTITIPTEKKNDDSIVGKTSVNDKLGQQGFEQKAAPNEFLKNAKKEFEVIQQPKLVEPTKTPEIRHNIPVLELVDPSEVPEAKPGDPILQLVTNAPDQGDPNGLHDYYGLDLSMGGSRTTYTIGSPAIIRHFKLKGSKHRGMFVITTTGLYYTSDTAVYDKSCNFYKIHATRVAAGANRTGPCPGSYFSVYARLSVYPCDRNVMYKIGNGNIEQADEYRFK